MNTEVLYNSLARHFHPPEHPPNQVGANQPDDWYAEYARGYVDGYLGQPYRMWFSAIDYPIFVPKDDPYRIGFWEGRIARN